MRHHNTPTAQISDTRVEFYFQGMPEKPCDGLLLLQAPVLWLSGLPVPPDDSLRVPPDGELLWPAVGTIVIGANTFSILFADLAPLRPSERKLANTIYQKNTILEREN